MHPLQSLIKDGKEPNENIEYVVTYDIPEMGFLVKELPVSKGTIVINVKRNIVADYHHGYEFTIKETGEKHITMYAWALAENTPNNVKELCEYWRLQEEVVIARKAVKQQSNKLKTLK